MSTRLCQHARGVSLSSVLQQQQQRNCICLFSRDLHGLHFWVAGWAPRESIPHAGRVKRNVGELSERHRSAVQRIQPEDGLNVARLHHPPGSPSCSVDAGSCILQDGVLFCLFFFLLEPPFFLSVCCIVHCYTAVLCGLGDRRRT